MRRYKQVVIQGRTGDWSCWFVDIEDAVYAVPDDNSVVHAKSLRNVLRKANRILKPADGIVCFTYMERFDKT